MAATDPERAEQDAQAQVLEYLGWDDQPPDESPQAREVIALAATLMIDEALPVHEAVAEAERRLEIYALMAHRWDCAAFEAGNDAALEGSIPF